MSPNESDRIYMWEGSLPLVEMAEKIENPRERVPMSLAIASGEVSGVSRALRERGWRIRGVRPLKMSSGVLLRAHPPAIQ